MARYRQINYGNPLPQSFLDALQDFLAVGVFNLQITQPNNTTLQIPASSGNGEVALSVNGLWRFNVASVSAAHPGGAPGTYDMLAVASGNVFVAGGGSGETDNTDYSFGLQIVVPGGGPTGSWNGRTIAASRKIGTLTWDGTKIVAYSLTANGGLQAHHTTHEPGGTDPLTLTTLTSVFNLIGTLGGRPAAASANNGFTYLATDVGIYYVSNGTTWAQASTPTSAVAAATLLFGTLASRPAASSANAPYYYWTTDTKILYQNQANVWVQITSAVLHASTHAPGGTDALTWTQINLAGTLASRPAASSTNNGLFYFATDTNAKGLYRSNGTTWDDVLASAVPQFVTLAQFAGITPVDGMRVYLQVDAANGIVWPLRYNAGSASANKWEAIGVGTPLVSAANSIGNQSATYLATAVAVSAPRTGEYDAEVAQEAWIYQGMQLWWTPAQSTPGGDPADVAFLSVGQMQTSGISVDSTQGAGATYKRTRQFNAGTVTVYERGQRDNQFGNTPSGPMSFYLYPRRIS